MRYLDVEPAGGERTCHKTTKRNHKDASNECLVFHYANASKSLSADIIYMINRRSNAYSLHKILSKPKRLAGPDATVAGLSLNDHRSVVGITAKHDWTFPARGCRKLSQQLESRSPGVASYCYDAGLACACACLGSACIKTWFWDWVGICIGGTVGGNCGGCPCPCGGKTAILVMGAVARCVIQTGRGIEARNFNALVSNGSTSYVGTSSSSSEDWSYFHRSDCESSISRGGLVNPRRSIHSRFRRPQRRRNFGGFASDFSSWATPLNLNKGKMGSGLSSSIGVGSSKDSDDAEAGGVIKYCVLAGLKLISGLGPETGDNGPLVRSIWPLFQSLWFWTFFAISRRSSFSFSAILSANCARSASAGRPSGLTGSRSCAGGGGR